MRTLTRLASRTVLRLALLAALVVAAFVALSGVVDALPAPGDLWPRATSVAAPSRPSGDTTPAVVTRVIDGDTITVSTDTDQSLRMFLASQGGGRKGDLSRFIEEAVRAHILELSAEQAKVSNAHLSEAELTEAVEEALDWARKR